jgi:hypothetical protein
MTTTILSFSGHSDDVAMVKSTTIVTTGEYPGHVGWEDEFYSHFKIWDGNRGLVITPEYYANGVEGGVWGFTISPIGDENSKWKLPAWPISYGIAENGYSLELFIEISDNFSREYK